MDLVVGHDRTEHGDDALRAAARLARSSDAGLDLGVVVVLTQQDLDATGELAADQKRSVAIERAFPAMWRRIDEVLLGEGIDSEQLSLDVVVRVAAVHLVRSQERIALELLGVMRDHGATRIVLGREGRPGGVAEYLLAHGAIEALPDLPEGVRVVAVDPSKLELDDPERVRSGPK
ncbi:MAG TPA: hypothetical protein VL400_23165 [Polyangiaceae bacterium]|nr:hypothetical protein [Polyangiaceae bacterium]